jgi:aldehyde:ferredoxin oxidoreductase
MVYHGFAGTTLFVDLATKKIDMKSLDLSLAAKFIGGWGMDLRMAYSLIKSGETPLSAINPIIISAGPLVGTMFPSAAKIVATTKLPLTGTIAGAVSGSRRFGFMLKSAGYDQLIITGKSENPVYLEVIDDRISICDAKHLWGRKDSYEVSDELMNEGKNGIIAIGAAGENLVSFSLCLVDKNYHLGRGGLGAVMGSKKLKAIVVRGTGGISIREKRKFMNLVGRIRKQILNHPSFEKMKDLGTMAGWETYIETMNEGNWDKDTYDKFYGFQNFAKVKTKILACTACMLPCAVSYEIKSGEFKGHGTQTGHFDVIAAMGHRLEIADYRDAIELMDLLNRCGLCCMTFSGLVDFVTRLFEQGTITRHQTGGLELKRNLNTYILLANIISRREGFGNILADGWKTTSQILGIDSSTEYLQGRGEVKGADSIYDARFRSFDAISITQIVHPRGAHSASAHSASINPLQSIDVVRKDCKKMGVDTEALNRIFDPSNPLGFSAGRLARHAEDAYAVYNSLGICTIYAVLGVLSIEILAEAYSAATGIQTSARELKKAGELVHNLLKVLNVREGFERKNDVIPEIWLKPRKTPDGLVKMKDYYGKKVLTRNDVHEILDEYYDERGWELDRGRPTKEKLIELGLNDIAEDLEKKGLCRVLSYA